MTLPGTSIPAMVEELKAALELFPLDGEDAFYRFERLAAWFHRDTGFLAPGKDQPMSGPDQPDGGDLRRIYEEWFASKVVRAREALPALLSALETAHDEAWLPIETAPKDGSTFIGLGLNHAVGPEVHMALVHWAEDRHEPGFYDRAESDMPYSYLTLWCAVRIPALPAPPKVHPNAD